MCLHKALCMDKVLLMVRPARLVDVAAMAEVDIATASRALNRSAGVERLSQACITRVEDAARALNYRPNTLARRLRGAGAQAIGLLLNPGPEMGFSSQLFAGLDAAVRRRGLHLVLISNPRNTRTAIDFHREKRIDGLIAPWFTLGPDKRRELVEAGIPHVLTHAPRQTEASPSVALDLETGLDAVVAHLAELGHRRLLWVGPDLTNHPDATTRHEAYLAACKKHRIETETLAIPNFAQRQTMLDEIDRAREMVLPALKGNRRRFSAVACYHDTMALGVLAAAREAGLQAPRDLSVTGIDDVYGEVADPALTTLSYQPLEMAQAAVDCLMELMARPSESVEFSGEPLIVTPKLVIRRSTGPPGS